QLDTGIPLVEQAVAFDPKNAELQFCLGMALVELGERQNALAHLTEALRLAPQDVPMLWQTAWLLATSADPSIRDGARALQLATKAVQKSDGRAPHAFDAQAAALAETENFEGAVAAAERGSALALTQGDTALADAIDARIRLYRQGTAYHQPASSVPKLDGAAAQPAE
ncbi:MAG TPA: tetratricopeptide repeat protein, partial [Pirellulales bacterium]|nr:tetratricopeptide repeat protein [Pirellulales bacterium]